MNDDMFEFDIDAQLEQAEAKAEKKPAKCRMISVTKPIAKAVKSDVSVNTSSKRISFFIRFFISAYPAD